ncbi:SWIM zinc finger family protein [Planosporangium sp. 12N6]|uniref:SWIM zinc finger family protein n=1 Tax=Planosporangium spinosum TaxID=3402278 RepID=UPI003CF571A1
MSVGNSPGSGGFRDFARPRRVSGGIKARSARGAIGESWWSRRFIAVLESFALGTRLTRGRAYARAGQVLSLTVAPGTVTASVQGSRPDPYAVTVGLQPFPEPVWSRVEEALAAQALFGAQLLAGEMPPEIEDVFAEAGAPLFPESMKDLRLACSCPDWSVPCKHLAATFYLLAEAFDTDPFQILYWRGRDRDTLLARLRALRGGTDAAAGPAPAASPAVPVGAATALADLGTPPLAQTLDRFWVSPVPLPQRPPTLDVEPDLLLRQLPVPGPELGGAELAEALRAHYRDLGRSSAP